MLFAILLSEQAQAILVDRIAAIVNQDVILLSDIRKFHETLPLRRELDPLFGFSQDLDSSKSDPTKTLEFLIQERLIGQAFKKADEDVEREVLVVQKNTGLTKDQLTEFLKGKGFQYRDYFELMRIGLQKRDLLDREIRSRVNITDDDVKNHYVNSIKQTEQANLDYNIQLIALNYSTYKTKKAAQEVAESALLAIQQGEPFAEVARRYSDDLSAQNGGELGFLPTDQLAKPLQDQITKMKIGQTSSLIQTQAGYIIVKLIDAKTSESTKMNSVKEQIREKLAKEEYRKQIFLWAERARNNAYVHTNKL